MSRADDGAGRSGHAEKQTPTAALNSSAIPLSAASSSLKIPLPAGSAKFTQPIDKNRYSTSGGQILRAEKCFSAVLSGNADRADDRPHRRRSSVYRLQ
jgi:hypothetical protein